MKRWFLSAARAYEREPELFLLAAGVVLVVVLWHLPVPAFLFGEEGSGSGSGAVCQCSLDPCSSWAYAPGDDCAGQGYNWEACNPGAGKMVDCDLTPGADKKMPLSMYTYDVVDPPDHPGCTNWAYGGCSHIATWNRIVNLSGSGQGTKLAEFKPKLRVDFSGFQTFNVCNGSTGQIRFDSAFFAAMQVCGYLWRKDPRFGTGWAFATHYFQETEPGSGEWTISAAGYPAPDFNISAGCACGSEVTHQEISFQTEISGNSGVAVGGYVSATLAYFALSDETTCKKYP